MQTKTPPRWGGSPVLNSYSGSARPWSIDDAPGAPGQEFIRARRRRSSLSRDESFGRREAETC
jgi:hypothetical protein